MGQSFGDFASNLRLPVFKVRLSAGMTEGRGSHRAVQGYDPDGGIADAVENAGLLAASVLEKIKAMQLDFFGIRLSEIPSLKEPGPLLLIPLISGLSALALCLYQDRANVLQREQGKLQQWGMTVFLVLFSLYFTFLVPAGIGLYWICSMGFSEDL